MALPRRNWMEMTWQEIAAAGGVAARWIAVLPLAAVEQHGPHLPLGVDSYIAEAYLARVQKNLPDDLPVTFLPVQRVGVSAEHLSYPGTLTISATTAIAAWTELGESLGARGRAQACADYQPWRQCRGHGDRGARPARAARYARGHRRLAPLWLSGRHVFGRREKARHSRRRRRDFAHARREAGNGAHGQSAECDAGDDRDGARVQMARRLSAGRLRLDDARPQPDRRCRRRHAGECRQRARPRSSKARRRSWSFFARSTDSISRACAKARWRK